MQCNGTMWHLDIFTSSQLTFFSLLPHIYLINIKYIFFQKIKKGYKLQQYKRKSQHWEHKRTGIWFSSTTLHISLFTDCYIPIRLGNGNTYPNPGTRCRGTSGASETVVMERLKQTGKKESFFLKKSRYLSYNLNIYQWVNRTMWIVTDFTPPGFINLSTCWQKNYICTNGMLPKFKVTIQVVRIWHHVTLRLTCLQRTSLYGIIFQTSWIFINAPLKPSNHSFRNVKI